MKPTVQHTAIIGTTRYGKSECCLTMNHERMGKPDSPAFVIIDPPGGMARSFAVMALSKGCFYHNNPKVIYDRLADTENVPGYSFLEPSTNPNDEQRAAENREKVSEAKAILLRSRGLLDASKNPIYDEGLTNALNLFIYQKGPTDIRLLKECFLPNTEGYRTLLRGCTNEEIKRAFTDYGKLATKEWEFRCAPAYRILKSVLDSPQFFARCRPTFNFAKFLNAGGIWIGDGESRGNLSRDDMALLFGMRILNVIQLARSGQLTRPVVLIIDEGVNASLIDLNIARALAEAAKWGLEIQLIVQNPLRFPDEAIKDSIFQNCDRLMFFKQVNSEAAAFAADMCAVPQLDPYKVHSVSTRTQTSLLETVSQTETAEGKSKTRSKPKYREKVEEFKKYMSLDEQVKLWQKTITNLNVGECIIRTANTVSPIPTPIPLTRLPWHKTQHSKRKTLADAKLEAALKKLRTRPEYQRRVTAVPTQTRVGAATRLNTGK